MLLTVVLRGLVLMLAAAPLFSAQGSEQSQIVRALAQGSEAERADALVRIRAIPVEARGAEVLQALLDELGRQNARLAARSAALREGKSVGSAEGEGEFLLDVLDLVTQHKDDRRIIPALIPFIATGNRVINVLAGFGEQAVAQVASVAASETHPAAEVSSALLTLQRMLEKPGDFPLSSASRQLVVNVAGARLTGMQPPTVVRAAASLAIATGDSAFIQRVQALQKNRP